MTEAPNGAEILIRYHPPLERPGSAQEFAQEPSRELDRYRRLQLLSLSARDSQIAEIDNGLPESVWVQQHIGHPVTKLFNNIYAPSLVQDGKPKVLYTALRFLSRVTT